MRHEATRHKILLELLNVRDAVREASSNIEEFRIMLPSDAPDNKVLNEAKKTCTLTLQRLTRYETRLKKVLLQT